MSDLAAIAFGLAVAAWALAAWDIARKWVADRSGIALHRKHDDFERLVSHRNEQHERAVQKKLEEQDARLGVNKLAIENLAKELEEEAKSLRAQQVGVLSGMQQRRRFP